MAYMGQEKKALIATDLKKVMPHNWKYSLGVNHHSTIVLTIASAPVDLVAEWNRVCELNHHGPEHLPFRPCTDNHIQINEFYLERQFDKHLPLFNRIKACLNTGNHNRSDMMTDYFDVGWYVSINIGRYDKPFVCTGRTQAPVSVDAQLVRCAELERENETLRQRSNHGL